MKRWGATPDEWAHFDLMLGLTADLLPVVSNPEAKISPDSRMKGLGKTPSQYNRRGEVAGIADWTDRQTNPRQIEKWSANSDYGICVQTREVRGLDIDVPDVRLATRIFDRFRSELGAAGALPLRVRSGTGKRLAGFVLEGELRKRSFTVAQGVGDDGKPWRWIVELLATGQQFVAIGTHPSGSRYEWAGGLPKAFPTVELDDFERAWAALVAEFAIEPERRSTRRDGGGLRQGDAALGDAALADETAAWLEANWETYGTEGGKLFVACPWKAGHSSDSGETEAAWLLAGTDGYAQGHFACLHASCQGRTDQEFFAAVGRKPADKGDFKPVTRAESAGADPVALYLAAAGGAPDPVAKASTKVKATAPHPEGKAVLPLPGFERTKQGAILATVGNVAKAAASPQACGARLRFDTFRGELVIASPDAEDWRPFEDADAVEMRIKLADIGFEPVGKELMRDAIVLTARDHRFDTAIHWLENIVPAWDGVKRIERFYPDYFKTNDTPYTRACGLYVWTAHAGRVLEPGCQADMATILIGEQGLRKSSGVAAMSPDPDFFAKIDLDLKDADLARNLRGLLVGELDELKGLAGRESEAIRAWVTKRHERWTPKYQEYDTRFPRRVLLHGTANNHTPLGDSTGERRWLPMIVHRMVDTDRIEADRLQLWAEGRELWKRAGIQWQDAERLARAEHPKFKARDPWEGPVGRWLDGEEADGQSPRRSGGVTSEAVLVFALGLEPARIQKRDEMRVGEVLKACGMERTLRRVEGRKPTRVWVDVNDEFA